MSAQGSTPAACGPELTSTAQQEGRAPARCQPGPATTAAPVPALTERCAHGDIGRCRRYLKLLTWMDREASGLWGRPGVSAPEKMPLLCARRASWLWETRGCHGAPGQGVWNDFRGPKWGAGKEDMAPLL